MGVHSGRSGRRWRRVRKDVLDVSDVCVICGHSGSGDVDHDPPRSVLIQLGLDPEDPKYLRPAHGVLRPCPTCGRKCNREKSDRVDFVVTAPRSRDW